MSKALELLEKKKEGDPVKKPSHYNWHSLFECRELTSRLPFNEACVIKYLYRCGAKGTPADFLLDKAKSVQYLDMMADTPQRLQAGICDEVREFLDVMAARLTKQSGVTYTSQMRDVIIGLICSEFADIKVGAAFCAVLSAFEQTNLHDRTTLKARVGELLK